MRTRAALGTLAEATEAAVEVSLDKDRDLNQILHDISAVLLGSTQQDTHSSVPRICAVSALGITLMCNAIPPSHHCATPPQRMESL